MDQQKAGKMEEREGRCMCEMGGRFAQGASISGFLAKLHRFTEHSDTVN